MKLLTLKEGVVYASIIKLAIFPEYKGAVLRMANDSSESPKLTCLVEFFKDTDDGSLLLRPVDRNIHNFWWRAVFHRELQYDEAVAVKASYTITELTDDEYSLVCGDQECQKN